MIAVAAAAVLWAAAPAAAAPAAPGPTVVPVAEGSDRAETIERLTYDLEKIDRALDETKQLIRLSLDAPYLPDLYFHLAELYVQRSRFEHRRGIESQGTGGRALTDDRNLAVTLSKKLAIETYTKVYTDFPDYERRDQIAFFKGHELREMGDWDAMKAEYTGLIDKQPDSRWAIQARLILADHHFDLGEYDDAEKLYTAIVAYTDSTVVPMARYKLGWVRINQQKFKDALELFREAVTGVDALERSGKLGGRGKSVSVRREALLAMAWPYSEVRKAAQASAYFRELADSRETYIAVLRKLASRYALKAKNMAAASLTREVVLLSHDPEETLSYLPAIVNAVGAMPQEKPARYQSVAADVAAVTRTMTGLADRPEPYAHRLDAPAIDLNKVGVELEMRARDLATRAQVFAQNRADRDLERRTAQAYDAYLAAFPGAKDVPAMKADRAGALFDAGNFLPSGREYEEIAGDSGKDAREHDVYAAIVAYYRAIDEDAKHRVSDPERIGLFSKVELVQARVGLKQLGAFFVHQYPESDKVPEVSFNVARMHYQEGDLAGCVELFAAFVRKYPTAPDVPTAGRLALDALYKLEKLDEMAALADSFAKNEAIASAEFRAEAGKLAEAARRRKVEYAVLSTPDADFGKHMLDEFAKHKGSKEGEQYLYAGFARFKSQGDITNTFAFGDKLIANYPASKSAPEVLSTMGNFSAQIADFERAAWLYEEFAKRYPHDKLTSGLLRNAAEMRTVLGEPDQAAADLMAVRAAGGAGRAEATAKLLAIYAGKEAWGQLATAAAAALSEGQSVTACFYAGLAEAAQHDGRSARGHFTCAARGQPQGDGEEGLAARATFELARLTQTGFEDVHFRGAGDAGGVLRQKLALLGDVENVYLSAMRSGDAGWSIAATYELSRLYRSFADFVMHAPVPAGVAVGDYRAALAEQANPYKDRAKQTLAACGLKSEQIHLMTPYGRACVLASTAEVELPSGVPPRAAAASDPKYKAQLDQVRMGLQKNIKNLEVLKKMARLAMGVGDYHYARLVLAQMAEAGGRPVDAWMGVAQWALGDVQGAAETLERARRGGSDAAALNLAALYQAYGYKRLAKQIMPDGGRLSALSAQAAELHPLARRLLRGGGDDA